MWKCEFNSVHKQANGMPIFSHGQKLKCLNFDYFDGKLQETDCPPYFIFIENKSKSDKQAIHTEI